MARRRDVLPGPAPALLPTPSGAPAMADAPTGEGHRPLPDVRGDADPGRAPARGGRAPGSRHPREGHGSGRLDADSVGHGVVGGMVPALGAGGGHSPGGSDP